MTQSLQVGRIQDTLKTLGWSQRRLADEVEVSAQTVTNWLRMKDFPRPAALLKLSQLLTLTFDELVEPHRAEPIIAFRRKAATKTTLQHIEKAKNIGYLLQPLIPFLDTLEVDQTIFRSPTTEYDTVQKLAASRRAALGVSQEAVLGYEQLINAFGENGALLVPVLWGETKRHENALHILLPEENVTFVYLNLDARIVDFKFWMAHELGHIFTPALCGKDEGEDFADALAGALLFPRELAEDVHRKCVGRQAQDCVRVMQQAASAHEVSLFTVFTQVCLYRERVGCAPLPVSEKTVHQIRNSGNMDTVRARIWGAQTPSPELYIEASRNLFNSPFFDALRRLLASGQGGVGYIQQVLDMSRVDATGLHDALMH